MEIIRWLGLCFVILLTVSGDTIQSRWQRYKVKHGRKWNSIEDNRRFEIYQESVKRIEEHNTKYDRGEVPFKLKTTQFSDMSRANSQDTIRNRFQVRRNKAKSRRKFHGYSLAIDEHEPGLVDWRQYNIVTTPIDQGKCASCWSIAAIGALESQIAMEKGVLTPLSPQQLIDCTMEQGNSGCKGGTPDSAFEYMKDKEGIVSEQSYPYTGLEGVCPKIKNGPGAKITDYEQIPAGDENALKKAVKEKGTIAAGITATAFSFQHYDNGIYEDIACNNKTLDHSVLICGYGTEKGLDYWLIKNSWGTDWGQNGFGKIRRNKNQCGIATMASYPEL